MTRVWQIAGGPASRSYVDVLLRHGVGLIGPGDAGPWRADRSDSDFGGKAVRRFATLLNEDSIVVLRSGNATMRAIGLVAGGYAHLEQFDDVNGWDLQHARRVRWFELPAPHTFEQPVFGARPARCGRVSHPEVLDVVRRLFASPLSDWRTAPLPPLPAEEAELDEMPPGLREVVAEARDFASQPFGEGVLEDEALVHLVVPLFRALGWRPEQIAVKWRRVDVALFSGLPRRPGNCHLIVEAKYPGAGIERALKQARRYARTLQTNCNLLVTDGYRYRLYAGGPDGGPLAYANLLRLKKSAAALFERLRRP